MFLHLPLLITEVPNMGQSSKYKSKHGFLKRSSSKERLDYRKNYDAEILQIFTSKLDNEKLLSAQQACAAIGGE
jgi:hypothetical protein